jgi:predicted DNA-binding transcriptional regulator AlpA
MTNQIFSDTTHNYRSLGVLLDLPPHAWVTPDEAATILGLSKDALAARRSRGEWPQANKLGPRLIRYRLGELLRIGQSTPAVS